MPRVGTLAESVAIFDGTNHRHRAISLPGCATPSAGTPARKTSCSVPRPPKLQEVDQLRGNKSRLFFKLAPRGISWRLVAPDPATGQRLARARPRDQQDPPITDTQHRCPVFHAQSDLLSEAPIL